MKKSLLLLLAIGCGNIATAQNANIPQVNPSLNKAVLWNQKVIVGNEIVSPANNNKKLSITPHVKAAASPTETVVGQTYYDLQSNSSVQNRIYKHPDGTISTIWTYSDNTAGEPFPDRGTGYNYFNGSIWGAFPTVRLETQRNGWGSISATDAGAEVVMNHNTDAAKLYVVQRPAKGTGAWGESLYTSPAPDGNWWPRMAVGGANGQTVHLISITYPVANGGALYLGQDGAHTYSRSLDGGTTWDINHIVHPQVDLSNFIGFRGDEYSIAEPVGDTIAYALFSQWADLVMMKSTDNGTTWTKTIVNDFPLDLYDPNGISDINADGIADTLVTSDGAGAILLDNNGMAHIFFGNMKVFDDDPAGDGRSFFPATNGLMYWNENFGTNSPVIIAGALDIDGNGAIDVVGGTIAGIADYFVSLSGMPNAGVAANGDMYVSYSAHMENLNQGTQNYRHIYVIKSSDGGCTWTTPLDVTATSTFDECVFASMARDVDNNVHILYQKDFEPGLCVRGDMDVCDLNEMVYLKIPVTDFGSTIGASLGKPSFTVSTADATCGVNNGNATVTIIGDTSQITYQWNDSMMQTSSFADSLTGGVYTVLVSNVLGCAESATVVINDVGAATLAVTDSSAVSCKGGNDGSATVTPVGGTSPYTYSWSPFGGTDSMAIGLTVGTYVIGVIDSAGCFSGMSVDISEPDAITATTASTDDVDNTSNGTATANPSGGTPGYSYMWDVNAGNQTTQTATGLSAGNYSVTVTDANNCTADFNVTVNSIITPGLVELNNKGSFSIYPNPNNGQFIVEFSNGKRDEALVVVRNIIGQLIYAEEVNTISGELLKIDLSGHNQGVYFLSLTNSSGTRTEKLIVY